MTTAGAQRGEGRLTLRAKQRSVKAWWLSLKPVERRMLLETLFRGKATARGKKD